MPVKTLVIFFSVLLTLAGGRVGANPLRLNDNPTGNKHDMSSANVGGVDPVRAASDTRICVYCHTPHGATAKSTLWNRKDPGEIGSFPVYNSATLKINKNIIPEAQYDNSDPTKYPNGSSRMCLSCHDGSTASGFGVGDLLNGASITMTVANLNGRSSQIDLSVSHPISFVYSAYVAGQITSLKGSTYQQPLLSDVPLDSQERMQCTTCHDPHDDRAEHAGAGVPPFWRHISATPGDSYADLCNTCHVNSDYNVTKPHTPGFGP
jgi:hypothetical protein